MCVFVYVCVYLVAVLHELGQVEQRLGDLSDVLGGEGQLDAADQLVLLVLAQLRPAGQERRVEQVPGGGDTAHCHRANSRDTKQLQTSEHLG